MSVHEKTTYTIDMRNWRFKAASDQRNVVQVEDFRIHPIATVTLPGNISEAVKFVQAYAEILQALNGVNLLHELLPTTLTDLPIEWSVPS